MGVIRLQCVVSFSSQDERYPAENLLKSSGSQTGLWLCSPCDKSGRLEAEFQLESLTHIHYVDVGNYGSSSVEVFVGRSSWPRYQDYVCLLPTISLMTPLECKRSVNRTTVRMFNTGHMNHEAVAEKWDRVKVICYQPYCKDKQFGLSFLRFGCKNMSMPERGGESTKTVSSSCSFILKRPLSAKARTSDIGKPKSSVTVSRARNLVKAAQRQRAARISRTPKKAAETIDSDATCALETDILCVLTSNIQKYSSHSFESCLEEFEEMQNVELNNEQKNIFQKVFYNVFPHSIDTSVSSAATVAPKVFYSQCGETAESETDFLHKYDESQGDVSFDVGFELSNERLKHSSHIQNVDSGGGGGGGSSSNSNSMSECFSVPNNSPGKSVDVSDELPEKKPRRKKKRITMKDMSWSRVTPNNSSDPSQFQNRSHAQNDFVQFDGSMPSTSKGVTYVDCPICDESFHASEIEVHAATCGDMSALVELPACSEVTGPANKFEVPAKRQGEYMRSTAIGCHFDNFVECPVCGNMFKQTALVSHTSVCIENCMA